MKSKPDFDPELLGGSPSRLWPIRSIGQLMVVVAASGVILAAAVATARQPLTSIIVWDPAAFPSSAVRPQLALYQRPDVTAESLIVHACPEVKPTIEAPQPLAIQVQPQPLVTQIQPRDPMVVFAPESLDPRMVVRAPAWIDPKVVFIPRGSVRQPEQGGLPAPRGPEIAPGPGPQDKPGPNKGKRAP
jgi:hypothetical protein